MHLMITTTVTYISLYQHYVQPRMPYFVYTFVNKKAGHGPPNPPAPPHFSHRLHLMLY